MVRSKGRVQEVYTPPPPPLSLLSALFGFSHSLSDTKILVTTRSHILLTESKLQVFYRQKL